jgi:hypothetical protein
MFKFRNIEEMECAVFHDLVEDAMEEAVIMVKK